jgi:AraC-like DNA-binding protein
MRNPTHAFAINPLPGKGELVVLFAGNAQTEPVHSVGPQVLEYHLVHIVTGGKGRFRCMGKEYELTRGDHFFIFPKELVSYVSDESDPWSYRWVGFKGTHTDQLLSRYGISPHNPTVHTGGNRRVPALFHQIEETLRVGLPSCDIQAGGYLRLLIGEYAKEHSIPIASQRTVSPGQQQVEQAIRWLTLQYTQPISIEQMAHDLGYHRTHLSKIFKEQTGLSPMNFLLRLRMERAKLLMQERLTIEQVASSVGFADALYFSKQFRKWYGCSPSEFRSGKPTSTYDCSNP